MTSVLEFVTAFSASILQALYLSNRKLPVRSILAVTILSVPVLFFSVESMNSILTCDESYIIYEPINLAADSLSNWNRGAFRTTDVVVGLPLAAIKKSVGFSLDIMGVLGKSLHWLIAFVLIIFIIDLLRIICSLKKITVLFYLLSLYAVQLLPAVLLAQKIINYDSLSMLCGIVAILLLVAGWRDKKPLFLYLSIVSVAFAAQEKLIASPFLWLCISAVPLRIAIQDSFYSKRELIKKTVSATFKVTFLAVSVFLLSHLLVSMVNKNGMPEANSFNLFYPLVSGLWPVLRIFGIDVGGLIQNKLFDNLFFIPLFIALLTVILPIVNLTIAFLYRFLRSVFIPKYPLLKFLPTIPLANYSLFLLLFILGVTGTYSVKAYLGPYFPLSPGELASSSFNSSFIHFGAFSLFSHLLNSIEWAYAVFFNSIPSVFLGLAAYNTFMTYKNKSMSPIPVLELFFTLSLLMPFLYGILQVPVSNRYFNLFTLILIAKMLCDLFRISAFGIRTRIFIVAAVFLLVLEIYPFRPLYGSFKPIWSNYSSAYNSSPSKAVLNPSGMGWGEEVAIGGRRIEKFFYKSNPELSDITIYHNYFGGWLYKKNDAILVLMNTLAEYKYTDNEFYIFNRNGIIQSDMNFPESVPVFDKISYRGFVAAWVFRGSDLKEYGYRLSSLSYE